MAEISRLRDENSELRRTQQQLAGELKEEKGLVQNLMGTIKNYEKILRLEGSSHFGESALEENDQRLKRTDSWGFLYRSIVLVDEECLEMTRTVTYMLEKVKKIEKIYESKDRQLANVGMRIKRLDTIAFGQRVDC